MDKGEQIENAIDGMPEILDHEEVVATLLTVAHAYAENDGHMLLFFIDCVETMAKKVASENPDYKMEMH